MALMENLASKLPAGIGYDWTGMSYQERLSGKPGSRSGSNFLCGCFPVPCCGYYESWSIPVSVMLVVPLGIVGVLLAATLFNQKNGVRLFYGGLANDNWLVGQNRYFDC